MRDLYEATRLHLARSVGYDASRLRAGAPLPYGLLRLLAIRGGELLPGCRLVAEGDGVQVLDEDEVLIYSLCPRGYRAEYDALDLENHSDLTEVLLGHWNGHLEYCYITRGLIFDPDTGSCINPPQLWRAGLSYVEVKRRVLAVLVSLGVHEELRDRVVTYEPGRVYADSLSAQDQLQRELQRLGHELGIFAALGRQGYQCLWVDVPLLSRHEVLALREAYG
jgi:hypothetical protein